MRKLFKARSIFVAMLLAVFMVASMFGAAFADTSDEYMMSYDPVDPDYPDGPFIYTYDDLQWASGSVRSADAYLRVGPSSNDITPSYFDSQADAEAVEWSFIDDGSVYVVQITETGADNWGDGWFAYAFVDIIDNVTPTQFGSVSIQALNPNATDPVTSGHPAVNLTLQINEEGTPAYTSANHVGYQIWNPNTGVSSEAYMTTNTGDFYETDTRTYPTVMDGVVEMLYASLFDSYLPTNLPGTGDFVQRITINGVPYDATDAKGWQYRVYRQTGNDYTVLDMSAVVGPDAFKLIANDIVVWKYGIFGQTEFPATIKPW